MEALFMKKKGEHNASPREVRNFYQLPTKIILQLLARQKKNTEERPCNVILRNLWARCRWLPKIAYGGFQYAHRHQFVFLSCLFFLLWHPGISSRTLPEGPSAQKGNPAVIPSRPAVYPVEKVALEVRTTGWILLYMGTQRVAAYPASVASLPKGQYCIRNLSTEEGETKAYVAGPLISQPAVFSAKDRREEAGPCVKLDRDYWEILYPYLRPGGPVVVK